MNGQAVVERIQVHWEHINDFIETTRIYLEKTEAEISCRRTILLQNPTDPSKFLLTLLFTDKEAAAFHLQTDHHTAWLLRTGSWMGIRKTRIFDGLYPINQPKITPVSAPQGEQVLSPVTL
jgi:quinol monooxygenase YgiN